MLLTNPDPPKSDPLTTVRQLLKAAKKNCRLGMRPDVTITNAEMEGVLRKLNTDPKLAPLVRFLILKTPDFKFETVLRAIDVDVRTDYNQSDLDPSCFYDVVGAFLIALSSTANDNKKHIIKSLAWHLERNMHTLTDKVSCDQMMAVAAKMHGPEDHKWHMCSVDGPPSGRYICCGQIVKNNTPVLKLLRNMGHRDPPERFVAEGYQLGGGKVSVPVTAEMRVKDAIALGKMVRFKGIRHNRVCYC